MAAANHFIVILLVSIIGSGSTANPCEFYKKDGQIVAENEVFEVDKNLPIGEEAVFLFAKNAVEVDLSDIKEADAPKIKYYLDLKFTSRNATDLNVVLEVRFPIGEALTKSSDQIKGTLQCMTRLGEMVSRDIVIRSSGSDVTTAPEHLQFNLVRVEYNIPENFPMNVDITSGRANLELHYTGSNSDKIAFSIVEKVQFEIRYEELPPQSNSKRFKLRLYLTELLDYETQTEYTFHVRAQTPTSKAEIPVTIHVQDSDDSNPVFEHKKYYVNISMFTIGQVPPVSLTPLPGKILAVNGDKGIKSKIVYKLLNCSEFATYFDVDEISGELVLKNPRSAYLHPRNVPTRIVIRAEKARNPKRRARTHVIIALPERKQMG